jgi:mannosyltransferase OCH1-like enzyme
MVESVDDPSDDAVRRFIDSQPERWFANSRIPRLVHHTWATSDLDRLPAIASEGIRSFACNDGATLQLLWSDQACAELVRANYSSLSELVRSLPHPVMRADLFRYMVLNAFGGVYTDVDTRLLRPVDSWVAHAPGAPPARLVLGIEADPDRPDWADWYARRLQWCQWTFAAAAGHPVLEEVIAESTRRIRRGVETLVMELTGPGVWTDSVNRWLEQAHGRHWSEFVGLQKPVRVGDALLLPITAFSPGIGHMGAGPTSSPDALVEHLFMGSWKATGASAR